MQEIFNIIEKLRNLSGNSQLEFLAQHKDNETLREILLFTYDTDKKYKIQEASLEKALKAYKRQVRLSEVVLYQNVTKDAWESFRAYLDKFSNAKGVKENEIEEFVKRFYDFYKHDELEYLFKGVLMKDIRVNMGVASFAKIWPETFSKPAVMLAKKFEGKTPNLAYYSRKLDGNRCYWMNGDLYSRTNKKFSQAPVQHILDQLSSFPHDFVLDGELIYFSDLEKYKEDFQKTVSLVAKDIRQPQCDDVFYVLFDIIPKGEFLDKKCKIPFQKTYSALLDNFNACAEPSRYGIMNTKCPNVKIVEQVSEAHLPELQQMVTDNSFEGVMIRDAEKPYECKRTSTLQKIKKMEDAEFNIVGFEIGTGKYSNTLGSIVIELETGEKVGVGSGFTEEARDNIWEHRNKIMNNNLRLKTQFFEHTTDKHGNNSLRFPVALCFRLENGEEIPLGGV